MKEKLFLRDLREIPHENLYFYAMLAYVDLFGKLPKHYEVTGACFKKLFETDLDLLTIDKFKTECKDSYHSKHTEDELRREEMGDNFRKRLGGMARLYMRELFNSYLATYENEPEILIEKCTFEGYIYNFSLKGGFIYYKKHDDMIFEKLSLSQWDHDNISAALNTYYREAVNNY